jgi:hypothetical protein
MSGTPSTHDRGPIRCDHCRKPFGRVVRRYFRMRFCSPDCLKAYQQRLDKLTRVKIERLNLSGRLRKTRVNKALEDFDESLRSRVISVLEQLHAIA